MNDIALSGEMVNSGVSHWMSRMLAPQSIAIVGASPRTGSMGQVALQLLQDNFYAGKIYLVNPRYEAIGEFPAYPDLHALPESPDLVLMVIGSSSMEASVEASIDVGAGGIVIFSNNFIENDSEPPLLERLKDRTRKAGIPVCGGNGMGFYNYDDNCLVSFDFPPQRDAG